MKNLIQFKNKLKNSVNNAFIKLKNSFQKSLLQTDAGEGYVDTMIKIVIAIVLGAIILGALTTLFNTTILTNVTTKITEMFS